jgi:signal transduction histidine kinase
MLVHVPTIYLFVGALYLLLPATVWLVLSGQRSSAAAYWCLGGEFVGVGLVLFGLRSTLPGWATYSLGNYTLWAGNLLLIYAVGEMLSYRYSRRWFVAAWVVFALIFEFFRLVLQSPELRFLWTSTLIVSMMVVLGYLSSQLGRIEGVRSARWLSRTYWAGVVILLVRICRVVFMGATTEAIGGELDSVLIVSAGLVTALFGNFAFVAVFLERASHRLLQVSQAQARQEEADRLGEQIAQLERQRTLGAMSASFAHELSQPLTAILMDAQNVKLALQDGTINTVEAQRSVNEIESSANRVVTLVNRIRNFIRPSPVTREPVDMQELVKEVLELLIYDIRREGVTFDFDFEAGNWVIQGDRVQLSQILLNVYRNAIQAMAQSTPKKIRVIGELTAEQVVIRIQDTGPGLSDDFKGKVGTPFITSKLDGLGVGFSISKAIAENHGGHLSISNAQGGGAVVELGLPITPPAA